MCEHRTLQQLMFGTMIECIKKWAEMGDRGWFDLRNEDTVKICQKLVPFSEKRRVEVHLRGR